MEYQRHGKTVVPIGGIFSEADSAIEFCSEFEDEPIIEKIQELKFTIDEDAFLQVISDGNPYYLTYQTLKEVCKILKLPASFINKYPINKLILDNLNENPYLIEDAHLLRFIVWRWEGKEVISGLLSPELFYMPYKKYLNVLKENNVFSRAETTIESIVITGEEIVLYFLLKDEITQENFNFKPGFALHYSPVRPVNTEIYPFYSMGVTTKSGEYFDFDFESNKKILVVLRRKHDFEKANIEVSTNYVGENLGIDLENTLKKGQISQQLSILKFSMIKTLKSRAASIFNYQGMSINSGAIVEEIIPEFKDFIEKNKASIKRQETYQTNSMLVDFFLPLFCNRIFTFRSSSENPYFFLRYRRMIGKLFDKILEEVGDIL